MTDQKFDYAKAEDQKLSEIVSSAEADIAKLESSEESYAPAAIRGLKSDAEQAQNEINKRLRKASSDVKSKFGKAAKALVRLIKREQSIKPETVSLEIVTLADQQELLAEADKKASKLEPTGHAVSLALKDLVIGTTEEQTEALLSLRSLAQEIKGGQTLKIVTLPKGTIKDLSEAYTESYALQLAEMAEGLAVHAKHWRKAPGPRGQKFKIVFGESDTAEERTKCRQSLNKQITEGKADKAKAIKIGKTVATSVFVPGKGKPALIGTIPDLTNRLVRVGSSGFKKAHTGSRNWLPDFLEPLGKRHGFKIVAEEPEAEAPADTPEADKAKAEDVTDHEDRLPEPASNGQPATEPTEPTEPATEPATASATASK